MNINRATLLAGVAALALTTGTGLAAAQQEQKGPNAAPQAAQPHASQPHAAAQPHPAAQPHAAVQPRPSQPIAGRANTGQSQRANRAANPGQAAQGNERENPRVGQSATSPRPNQRAQDRGDRSNEGTTAEERRMPRGLQGNASGQVRGQPQLSEEQRTHIRQTMIDARGAPRVGHVDFDVRIGMRISRHRIHLIPVPETLVQIDPEWDGFLYFVYEDEIVVVDPSDMEIVAVLPV
jgi:Protein of unknown function (DUF1236)